MSEVNNEAKKIIKTVNDFVEELKRNPSSRFSKSDFQMLVYYILSDHNFKAKKYLLRNDQILEEDNDISGAMFKFLDKLLKHAGMTESSERSRVIESFEFGAKDVDWVTDAVDEAMWIYTECGKNMRMFRTKMLQLTIQKMVRSGRYEGQITYKKKVMNRLLDMEKRKGGVTE